MIYKGFEETSQGMIAMRAMQDIIANDLANANTPGFQEDALLVSDFDQTLAAAMGEGTPAGFSPAGGGVSGDTQLLLRTAVKFRQGRLDRTGQPFDLAIDGRGFFTINARDGVRFTRDGSFIVNGEGYLVTKEGGEVMGDRGPIKVNGSTFQVKPDGTVWVDKKKIDKLRILWVDPQHLTKVGATDFQTDSPWAWHAADRPKIMQGYLEMSAANPIKDMVRIIAVMRAFEAGQKLMSMEDSMASKAIQVGSFGK